MEKYLIYLLVGFLGGITRRLVGFVKNKTIEKANHFKPSYFLAGYAGTDFIENLYKIKIGNSIKTKF